MFVEGVRTPFLASLTDFQVVFTKGSNHFNLFLFSEFVNNPQHLMPHQLLARTFQGILERTGLAADQVPGFNQVPELLIFQVDYLCAGTVQQEVRTSNIAKEAAFTAGCPFLL